MALNRDYSLLARVGRTDLKILPHLSLMLLNFANTGACPLNPFSKDLLTVTVENKCVVISNSYCQLRPSWRFGRNFIGPADIYRTVFPPHRLEHRLIIIITITKSGSTELPLSPRTLIVRGRHPVNRHRRSRVLMPLTDRAIFTGMERTDTQRKKKKEQATNHGIWKIKVLRLSARQAPLAMV